MKEIPIESTEQAISFEQKKDIVLSYLYQEKDNTKNQAQELKQESDESNDKEFLNNIKQKIENLLAKYKDIKSKIQLLEDKQIEKQVLEEIIEEYGIDTTKKPKHIITETYIDKETKQERCIEINIKKELKYWTNFYKENGVDWITLPESIQLQENQIIEMKRLIREYGFNKLLIMPKDIVGLPKVKNGNLIKKAENYSKLHTLMTPGYSRSNQSDNFWEDQSFDGVLDNSTKLRLVLTKDIKELGDDKLFEQTLKKSPDTLQEQFIDKLNLQALSLSEYIIYQREYFNRTGKHLDEKQWLWLLNSKMAISSNVPESFCGLSRDLSQLNFYSYESSYSDTPSGGCRLSGSFEIT